MEAIERLRFLASFGPPSTSKRKGGEKTQPFNRFHSHPGIFRSSFRQWHLCLRRRFVVVDGATDVRRADSERDGQRGQRGRARVPGQRHRKVQGASTLDLERDFGCQVRGILCFSSFGRKGCPLFHPPRSSLFHVTGWVAEGQGSDDLGPPQEGDHAQRQDRRRPRGGQVSQSV